MSSQGKNPTLLIYTGTYSGFIHQMLTQCPECNTTFRLHVKQLKAAGGKVRCSRCNATFDALDNLYEPETENLESKLAPSTQQTAPTEPALPETTPDAAFEVKGATPTPETEAIESKSPADEKLVEAPPPPTEETDTLDAFIGELEQATAALDEISQSEIEIPVEAPPKASAPKIEIEEEAFEEPAAASDEPHPSFEFIEETTTEAAAPESTPKIDLDEAVALLDEAEKIEAELAQATEEEAEAEEAITIEPPKQEVEEEIFVEAHSTPDEVEEALGLLDESLTSEDTAEPSAPVLEENEITLESAPSQEELSEIDEALEALEVEVLGAPEDEAEEPEITEAEESVSNDELDAILEAAAAEESATEAIFEEKESAGEKTSDSDELDGTFTAIADEVGAEETVSNDELDTILEAAAAEESATEATVEETKASGEETSDSDELDDIFAAVADDVSAEEAVSNDERDAILEAAAAEESETEATTEETEAAGEETSDSDELDDIFAAVADEVGAEEAVSNDELDDILEAAAAEESESTEAEETVSNDELDDILEAATTEESERTEAEENISNDELDAILETAAAEESESSETEETTGNDELDAILEAAEEESSEGDEDDIFAAVADEMSAEEEALFAGDDDFIVSDEELDAFLEEEEIDEIDALLAEEEAFESNDLFEIADGLETIEEEPVEPEAEPPPEQGDLLEGAGEDPLNPYSEKQLENMLSPTEEQAAELEAEAELAETTLPEDEPHTEEAAAAPVEEPSEPAPVATDYAIPAELTPRDQSTWTGTILWGVGIVVMVAGLLLQYVYYHRLQLVENPQLRPLIAAMCDSTGCQLPPRRDLGKIELAEHMMQFHPNYEESLLLTATLANRADFDQPYPLVEVIMTDVQQKVVAHRHFTPEQYLPNRGNGNFSAKSEVPLMLEVLDPGKNAVGFEFRFY